MDDTKNCLIYILALILSSFVNPAKASASKNIIYSAQFKNNNQELKLQISKDKTSKQLLAEIISQKQGTEALCEITNRGKKYYSRTVALEMSCKGSKIALTAPATILVDNRKQTIRFGTWLNGYQDFALKIQLNKLITKK